MVASRIIIAARLPISPFARLLPRSGAAMKMTRPISGRCRKKSSSWKYSRARDGSSACIFLRVQETGELVFLRIALLQHHGERHSEVACQRNRAPIERYRFCREWICEREDAAASLKMRYDG